MTLYMTLNLDQTSNNSYRRILYKETLLIMVNKFKNYTNACEYDTKIANTQPTNEEPMTLSIKLIPPPNINIWDDFYQNQDEY